jgi:hypothetical protein
MTEEQIELRVERMMDHFDRLLLAGQMSQRDYDKNVADLHRWTEAKRHAPSANDAY